MGLPFDLKGFVLEVFLIFQAKTQSINNHCGTNSNY